MKSLNNKEAVICGFPFTCALCMPTLVITLEESMLTPKPAVYVCAGTVRTPAITLPAVKLMVCGVWRRPPSWESGEGIVFAITLLLSIDTPMPAVHVVSVSVGTVKVRTPAVAEAEKPA